MAVLSGVLLALRAMGGALGWGFQLQSPWVVALLILLFGAITMNLAGLFEFTAGSRVADAKVLRDAPKTGLASSFLTGVLAVIVASPCTAPFMGAALGYALTQPAIEALLVFVALGLGMSMPWLLLCVFPQWAKRLPKPGPWMETFRKIMAVPMAAAVIWLGWVLSKQVDFFGMLVVVCGLGATAVFCWLLGREQWGLGRNRPVMAAMAILAAASVAAANLEMFVRADRTVAEGIEQTYPESPYLPILRSQVSRMDAQLSLLSQVKLTDFPEINMPDMYGNDVKLSSLEGKVILLHFWSAALGNGNAVNADLKTIYEKYHDLGFEIYQVAVDTSKAVWINAIQEQQLPWISVSDLQGNASPALSVYNVKKLPSNYLIDREGNIVGKDLVGERLDEAVRQYIGK